MKRIRRIKSQHGNQAGVALVEFALVLLPLTIFLFGILDFGRAFNYWNDETHLANEAARFAAVNKNPGGSVTLQSYIASQADSTELKSGSDSITSPLHVCISFPDGNSNVGSRVKVTVTSTYHFFGFLLPSGAPPSKELKATAEMRLEQQPTNYSADGSCA